MSVNRCQWVGPARLSAHPPTRFPAQQTTVTASKSDDDEKRHHEMNTDFKKEKNYMKYDVAIVYKLI